MSKHGEYSERLYDEERKLRIKAEHKCTECVFVQRANAAFSDGRTSEKNETFFKKALDDKHTA